MPRSLTLRLTLFFGVVSTAVLLAIGYLVAVTVDEHFLELDRADLDTKREIVQNVAAKVRTDSDWADLGTRLNEVLIGEPQVFARITATSGSVVYPAGSATSNVRWPTDELTARTSGSESIATWDDGSNVYRGMRVPISTASAGPAILELAMNIEHHQRFLHAFYHRLWGAIGLGIVASALLGWFAARRGLAPARAMARVARNITASRLNDRLESHTMPVELVDLAEAFNAMLSRLEDSFRRLSDYSSDIAHELRTPISNLLTQTQVALSRLRTAEEYREVLYSNVEEYERMARMIGDMLFLAKADNGLIVPRTEPVDLANEVRDLFDYYDALADERGVRLEISGEGTVPGERLMIRRAISNLLSNAMNYTAKGGCVNVRIDQVDGGATRLSVENPGETIPPEHLPRLFDRFYRVDPARPRSSEGAGLGLAITKSIVAAHRGVVRAFSADGVTRIEIVIP